MRSSRSLRVADLSSEAVDRAKREFVRIAGEICPGWTVNPCNRMVINDIFRWCMDLPGRFDLTKGLYLYGNIGTGKSTLLRIIKQFCHKVGKMDMQGGRYGFRIWSVFEACQAFQRAGYSGLDDYITSRRCAIDELGAENQLTYHFGEPLDVMRYILLERYERRRDSFTHLTSNMSAEDIRARYGDRVYDRFREMFNMVHLEGKSLRAN